MESPVEFGYIRGRVDPDRGDEMVIAPDAASRVVWELQETITEAERAWEAAPEQLAPLSEIITNGSGGTVYSGPPPEWKVGLLALHLASLKLALKIHAPDQSEEFVRQVMGMWRLHPAAERSITEFIDHAVMILVPRAGSKGLDEPEVPPEVRSETGEPSAVWEAYHMTSFYQGILPSLGFDR